MIGSCARTAARSRTTAEPTLADLAALVEESRRPDAVTARSSWATCAARRVGRTAYRIAQEGLTNARRHAPEQR